MTQVIHISLSSTGDINAHNLQWWHFQIKMLCFQNYMNVIVSPGKKKISVLSPSPIFPSTNSNLILTSSLRYGSNSMLNGAKLSFKIFVCSSYLQLAPTLHQVQSGWLAEYGTSDCASLSRGEALPANIRLCYTTLSSSCTDGRS